MIIGSGSYGRVVEDGARSVVKYSRGEITPSQVREIHALAAGHNTEGVCQFKEAWLDEGRFAISLDRYEYDGSRAPKLDFLESGSVNILRRRARGFMRALANLHQLRIMHRDIKPDNVLFRGDTIALCDFGLARQTTAGVRFTSPRCLSNRLYAPYFRAPEVDMGRYQWASDVYAAGIVLYYFATKRYLVRSHRHLFAESRENVRGFVEARLVYHLGREAAGVLIGPFTELVAAMIARRPKDRPSARECLDKPFLAGLEGVALTGASALRAEIGDEVVGVVAAGPNVGGWVPDSGRSAEIAYLAWRTVRDWNESDGWRKTEAAMYAACMAAAASRRCRSRMPSLPFACANLVCKYLLGRRPAHIAESVELEALRLTRGRVLPPESDDLVERIVETCKPARDRPDSDGARPARELPTHVMDVFGRVLSRRPGLLTDPGLPTAMSYFVRGDELPEIVSVAWRVFQVLVTL